ncbi:MAG: DUF202 domain-containing protein [Bacteroidota bacterium]|nr:DUF202 domain-containing protein [Bacteroidota bacterium]
MKEELKQASGDSKNLDSGARDHLANERTYLAWVRTSIGIMAFGFVVVKFSLFVKQIGLVLGKQIVLHQRGYSAVIGIVLVGVGSLSLILSFLQYKRIQKQLREGIYSSETPLTTLLTALIFLISVTLIVYLIGSV